MKKFEISEIDRFITESAQLGKSEAQEQRNEGATRLNVATLFGVLVTAVSEKDLDFVFDAGLILVIDPNSITNPPVLNYQDEHSPVSLEAWVQNNQREFNRFTRAVLVNTPGGLEWVTSEVKRLLDGATSEADHRRYAPLLAYFLLGDAPAWC